MAYRVLIVDDDENILTVLEESLAQTGYEVVSAMSAKGALRKIETELPNLVILDVMLPDMTGLEFNKQLKANPMTQSIPVVIITASTNKPPPREEMERQGIAAYLLKPFSMKNLLGTVRELLESQGRDAQNN